MDARKVSPEGCRVVLLVPRVVINMQGTFFTPSRAFFIIKVIK